jgi:hypothetical protein
VVLLINWMVEEFLGEVDWEKVGGMSDLGALFV